MKPATEILAEAKASLAEANRLIAKLEAQIDRALRIDAIGPAMAAKQDLKDAQDMAGLRARQIELLRDSVVNVPGEVWPTGLADARRVLAEKQDRLRKLEARFAREPSPGYDRPAELDHEHDTLIPVINALTKHVAFLEQYEASDGRG